MKRKKQRKLVNALPMGMPPKYLDKALGQISNDRARAQVRRRYERREAGH